MDWKLIDDRPIWMQLTEQLTERIVSNVYPAGSRLPSVRELAAQAGVNPNTMQRALSELENNGLAITSRTSGRMVTPELAVIEKVRQNLAEKCIVTYLNGMSQLGYDKREAVDFIAEREGK